MSQRSMMKLLLIGFVIVVTIISNVQSKRKTKATEPNTYKLPSLFSYLGVFFAFVFMFGMGKSIYEGTVTPVSIGIDAVMIVAAIALTLYFSNRKIKLENEKIIYTNWLKKTKEYSIFEITEIRQVLGGDYMVYIRGEKAFVIDQQVTEAMEAILKTSSELGRNIPLTTKASEQRKNFSNDQLVSKTKSFMYILLLILIVVFTLGLVLAWDKGEKMICLMLLGGDAYLIWYFIYSCTYKIVYDPIRRYIRVRKFIRTREYILDQYEKKLVVQREKQTSIALYEKKTGKRKTAINLTYVMTNRELITKKILN